MRDAVNGSEFTARCEAACGAKVEIVSGEEEAVLSYLGASDGGKCGMIDIGGGSTEFTLGDDARIIGAVSLQMGAVRMNAQNPIFSKEAYDATVLQCRRLIRRDAPMLLAAETQVTQAETPRNAEETPSPAPAETPEGPTTEQTENTGGQGESRPLSVVAADENGYTRVGDVFIKNSSRQTVEGIVFDGTFAAALGEDAPQVLIVHTHGSEAYTMPPGEEYEDTGSFRTADASVSVIRVGDELARVLSGYGISVLHDRALYDDPEYNGAYYRAEDAIEAYMEKYPSIGFILDVHRDALEDKAGHQYKVVTREDPDCAQVSLVMGSSWEGWQENLKFAVAVQQHLTERYPTLMRPLTLRNSDYNEYFTPGSLLVEIGAAGNSLDEALKAVRVFGEGFAEVVTGAK